MKTCLEIQTSKKAGDKKAGDKDNPDNFNSKIQREQKINQTDAGHEELMRTRKRRDEGKKTGET